MDTNRNSEPHKFIMPEKEGNACPDTDMHQRTSCGEVPSTTFSRSQTTNYVLQAITLTGFAVQSKAINPMQSGILLSQNAFAGGYIQFDNREEEASF